MPTSATEGTRTTGLRWHHELGPAGTCMCPTYEKRTPLLLWLTKHAPCPRTQNGGVG